MTVRWYGNEITARIRVGANNGVAAWIGIVESKAVELLTSGNRSGRVYTRRGVKHRASAPGEPPASDTGFLVNSRYILLLSEELAARLVFTARYANFLQLGTRKMEPRPFADRALNETLDEGRAAFNAAVAASLR